MIPRRVVVTEPVHEDALALLRDAGWTLEGPGTGPADACLVRLARLTADEVAGFAMISKHGVGVDNIPLDAARAAGVAVMNTPGANAGAVAEQAMLLLLALARDLDGQRAGKRGGVRGLEGLRLLVVGFGASGRRVAALAAAFGMAVTVSTPDPAPVRAAGHRHAASLDAGLAEADAVTLHCPLSPSTRGMIGAGALARLPRGALLVNCARGGLVDERALADALASGHFGGAALDATEVEPLPEGHPLRRAPRLILTPHAGGLSEAAFRRTGLAAAGNILDFFAGRPQAASVVVPAP